MRCPPAGGSARQPGHSEAHPALTALDSRWGSLSRPRARAPPATFAPTAPSSPRLGSSVNWQSERANSRRRGGSLLVALVQSEGGWASANRRGGGGGRGGRQSVRRGAERWGVSRVPPRSLSQSRQPPPSFAARGHRRRALPGTSGEGGAVVLGPGLRERFEAEAGV